jgi:hypothetical protein
MPIQFLINRSSGAKFRIEAVNKTALDKGLIPPFVIDEKGLIQTIKNSQNYRFVTKFTWSWPTPKFEVIYKPGSEEEVNLGIF